MEQTTTDGEKKRPTFLKVLCILSFIGTAWGLLSGLWSWYAMNALAGVTEAMGGAMGDAMSEAAGGSEAGAAMGDAMNQGMAMMGMDPHKQAMSALIVALLNIVVFAGAFMMWKLKKTGFYIYTLGQIASIAVPFIVVGGLMGGVTGIIMGIFAVAFIIMYGVNLKHMS